MDGMNEDLGSGARQFLNKFFDLDDLEQCKEILTEEEYNTCKDEIENTPITPRSQETFEELFMASVVLNDVEASSKMRKELRERFTQYKIKQEKQKAKIVPQATPSSTLADEIKKLSELKAQGLLTEEEFTKAKADLLK